MAAARFVPTRSHSAAEQLGVELVDVQLQRIDLPDEAVNAVYQRMQQSFTAGRSSSHAQGSAEADKIRAEAERRRAEILADASREAQRIRGEADAAAAAIYARRLWGAIPNSRPLLAACRPTRTRSASDGDIFVISPEGEFFKYLHSASGR